MAIKPKKRIYKVYLVLPFILAACLLSACGGSRLVGRWESDSGEILIFRDDYTGLWDIFDFTWHVKGKTLTITSFLLGDDDQYQYSISGNELTLRDIYSDGSVSDYAEVYVKKGKPSVKRDNATISIILVIGILGAGFLVFKNKSRTKLKETESGRVTFSPYTPYRGAVGKNNMNIPPAGSNSTSAQNPVTAAEQRLISRAEADARLKPVGRHVAYPAKKPSEPEKSRQNKEPAAERVICPICGAALPSGAAFCHKCGSQLKGLVLKREPICVGCGAKLPEEGRFCPNCGKKR